MKDLPMGATIVCLFGVTVAVVSLSVRMKYVDEKAGGEREPWEPAIRVKKPMG